MAAADRYEEYFTEKLWGMIPELHRSEDGLPGQSGVLRAIVQVIAEQAAISRRSIDRLWEDQHVETCDDWAVPYIGDLVGTRLLPESDPRARRVDVARTVHFRRRRGTPSLLAEIVDDLSGWDVVLVEAFRRLVRTAHRLDLFPVELGRVTRTPVAGTANLRNPRASDLAGSPFDEFFRTADVRLLRGKSGRYGLGNVNLHLFRVLPFGVVEATPSALDDGSTFPAFTFDPSGRDVPLFTAGVGVESTSRRCTPSQEWEIARRIPCRLLSDASFQISFADLGALPASGTGAPTQAERDALETLVGFRFANEPRLRQRLRDLGVSFTATTAPSWYENLLELATTPDSARPKLYPASVRVTLPGTTSIEPVEVLGADLLSRDCQPDPANPLIRVLIDPDLGRFSYAANAENDTGTPADSLVDYFYGFSGEIGAGPYEREPVAPLGTPAAVGTPLDLTAPVVTLATSRTYSVDADDPIEINDLVLQSDGGQRPYVEFNRTTPAGIAAIFEPTGDAPTTLTFDGVWLASAVRLNDAGALEVVFQRSAADTDSDFDWTDIRINCTTLDPGGVRADEKHLAALRITVRSNVKLLRISRSIVGPIFVDTENDGSVETIEIVDSIVDATGVGGTPPGVAIESRFGHVRMAGVTVIGEIRAERVVASDCIVMGKVIVADTQHSCLRFSAVQPSEDRMPDLYRSFPIDVRPFYFTSLRFGDPGYGELSVLAPEALATGAENGSEMGAFSGGARAAHMASLAAKVDEFKPVAILTQFVIEGETASGSLT